MSDFLQSRTKYRNSWSKICKNGPKVEKKTNRKKVKISKTFFHDIDVLLKNNSPGLIGIPIRPGELFFNNTSIS